MARAGDQIGAAIPGRRFSGGWRKSGRFEIEPVPARHEGADVERKRQKIGFDRAMRRGDRLHICPQGGNIRIAHARISGIGHCGIKPLTAGAYALAHGADEIGFAPGAQTEIAVGRDVGRGDLAEGRLQHGAAGERLAARRGVTALAIAQDGLITAVSGGTRLLCVRGSPGGGDQQGGKRKLPHAVTSGPGCLDIPIADRFRRPIGQRADRAGGIATFILLEGGGANYEDIGNVPALQIAVDRAGVRLGRPSWHRRYCASSDRAPNPSPSRHGSPPSAWGSSPCRSWPIGRRDSATCADHCRENRR